MAEKPWTPEELVVLASVERGELRPTEAVYRLRRTRGSVHGKLMRRRRDAGVPVERPRSIFAGRLHVLLDSDALEAIDLLAKKERVSRPEALRILVEWGMESLEKPTGHKSTRRA